MKYFLFSSGCVQIIEEDGSLVEIGPRFVLNLMKIFQGSFGGPTLYENPDFRSPNMVKIHCTIAEVTINVPDILMFLHRTSLCMLLQHRREMRLAAAAKVREKQMVKEMQKGKKTSAKEDLESDVTADVFLTPAEEKPADIQTIAPETKVVKKKQKAFKRQRMQMARR